MEVWECMCKRQRRREFNASKGVGVQTFLYTVYRMQIDIIINAVWQYGP